MSEAGGLENLYQTYKDDGFVVMNVIGENADYAAPTTDDLAGWAETYGMTFPVVADSGWGIAYQFGMSGGIPFIVLLDRGVVMESNNYPTESEIEALISGE